MGPTVAESLRPLQVLKRADRFFTPDVTLVEWEGTMAILKDYAGRGWPGRLWGQWVTAREAKALERLDGLNGVPRLLTRVGKTGIVIEHFAGDLLPKKNVRQLVTPQFFDAALALLRAMHERGVAHGDVRRKNILVRPDGSPAFIDFQTACFSGRGWLRQRLFSFACRVDEWHLVKIKARSFPRATQAEQKELLESPPFVLRVGQTLRRILYRALGRKRSGS